MALLSVAGLLLLLRVSPLINLISSCHCGQVPSALLGWAYNHAVDVSGRLSASHNDTLWYHDRTTAPSRSSRKRIKIRILLRPPPQNYVYPRRTLCYRVSLSYSAPYYVVQLILVQPLLRLLLLFAQIAESGASSDQELKVGFIIPCSANSMALYSNG